MFQTQSWDFILPHIQILQHYQSTEVCNAAFI